MPFPDHLQQFVDESKWIFATTFADTWHHEYLLRGKVRNERLLTEAIEYVRKHGVKGRFYSRTIIYYESHGMTYWDMNTKSSMDTEVFNRCPTYATFERRLVEGRLPKRK